MALEGAIGRGAAGELDIAEAADILDGPTRARLHEKLDARRAEDAARDRRIETVSAVLAGRAPVTGEGDGKPDGGGDGGDADPRPGTPGWPQAVDDHYASLADTLETMDTDERARFEDDYARATGVIPGAVAKTLRAGLLSADPAEQVAAATRLAGLEDGNPALVSVIPADELRRAAPIAEFACLGLPAPRAVELAKARPAGVGGDDQPAGSAGDNTPEKDVIETTEDGGAGEDTLEGGAGEPRQTPKVTPATIAEFFDDAAELEGQDFSDAAIAAGMDPGRAALVRDIFRSTEDDRAALIERIGEQPRAFWADFKSLLSAIRAAGDDQEARRRVLLTSRSLVRAERQGVLREAEILGAVLGVGVGGRGKVLTGKKGTGRAGARQAKPPKRPRPEPDHPRNSKPDEAVKTKGFTKPKPQTAEDVNRRFPDFKDAPPAKLSTKAWRARMQGVAPGDFVRLHRGNKQGHWIMRREQVLDAKGRLLSPQELQRKFALPKPPTHISDLSIPPNKAVDVDISIVRPAPGWKGDEVVQYSFDELPPDAWLTNTLPLKEWRY